MSKGIESPTSRDASVDRAQTRAARFAKTARVTVSKVADSRDVDALRPLIQTIWGPSAVPAPDLLRALGHAGTALLVAREREAPSAVVGLAWGFMGWSSGTHFHSHQVGVVPGARRRGVARALKWAQAAVCAQHGINELRWTFDPLLTRNARFNFEALGATGCAFYPEFYGEMRDLENAGDLSDRLVVRWVPGRVAGPAPEVRAPVLHTKTSGLPARTNAPMVAGARLPIPEHYRAMRREDPATARAWRLTVRSALSEASASGLIPIGFLNGSYILGPKGYQPEGEEN